MQDVTFFSHPTNRRVRQTTCPRTVAGIPFIVGDRADPSIRGMSGQIRFARNPVWRGAIVR
jgi:hypothetical protein